MLRLFKAFFYLITFRIGKAADALSLNPGVMSAQYDNVIAKKKERIKTYMDAISGMVAEEERKKSRLRILTSDIERLEKLKAGALSKAKQIVAKYGDNVAALKTDAEYIKCQAAFKDFTSTLEEKQNSANELDADIGGYEKQISTHKVQIQSEMRALEKLKGEKHDAVTDVISASEAKKISDAVNNISDDTTEKELASLRELRQKAKASSRVSQEMAGLDAKAAEEEFLEFAISSEADNEFEKLIGLTKTNETATVPSASVSVSES